jgi:uncharacterized membrane protein YidH (DUF202 family)
MKREQLPVFLFLVAVLVLVLGANALLACGTCVQHHPASQIGQCISKTTTAPTICDSIGPLASAVWTNKDNTARTHQDNSALATAARIADTVAIYAETDDHPITLTLVAWTREDTPVMAAGRMLDALASKITKDAVSGLSPVSHAYMLTIVTKPVDFGTCALLGAAGQYSPSATKQVRAWALGQHAVDYTLGTVTSTSVMPMAVAPSSSWTKVEFPMGTKLTDAVRFSRAVGGTPLKYLNTVAVQAGADQLLFT